MSDNRLPTALHLTQLSGATLTTLPPLDGLCRIGRAPDADLLLPDQHVSRQHAVIERHGARLRLRDLGSRSGTEVNGQRVDPARPVNLHPGDRLRISDWLFELAAIPVSTAPTIELPLDQHSDTLFQRLPDSAAHADMAVFARFAASVANCREPAELDRALLAEVRARGGLDAAVLLVPGSDGTGVRIVCADPPAAMPRALSRALLDQAASGDVLLVDETAATAMRTTFVGLPPSGSICVALREAGQPQAWLYGWRHGSVHANAAFGDYLRALAELGQALRASLLARVALEQHARLDADLRDAQAVQRRLLPPAAGDIGTLSHACLFRPGRSVSGDLLLLQAHADGGCRFVLGDVAGSGTGAAMLMAQLCGLAQGALQSQLDLAATAALLNRALLDIGEGRFASAILGHLPADASYVELIDAGHGLAFWGTADGALCMPTLSGGPPLGVLDAPYASCRLPLPPGARLLLVSDGVPELRNAAGEAFGTERLLTSPVGSTPAAQVAAMASAMDAWSGPETAGDDASVLLIQRR